MKNPFSLQGRKALVTGANTGLGQAIAVGLAAAGAEVVCAARRAPDETLDMIAKNGGKAAALSIDFADPLAARDSFADAGFDILVNNAGIIRRADSVEFSELDWDEVMDVNLKALFFTTQAFAKELLAKGRPGKVVNIASLLSFQGGIRVPAYTAAKHGVAGLTKLAWCDRDLQQAHNQPVHPPTRHGKLPAGARLYDAGGRLRLEHHSVAYS